jgi:hypothetical protein
MTLVALLNRLTVRRAPARPALPALLMLLMLLVLLAVPGGLRAQDDHAHHGPPPERLGRVNFPADCRPAVRARFERAVALLHSFWYEEAARTFAAVGEADSTCALAEWGMAMSTLHPLWTPPTPEQHAAARAHAERAVELSRPGTRPRDYAEAIAAYYRGDGVPDRTRLAAYEQAMAGVARRWPRDEEARILHALALIALGQQDACD